MLKPLGRIATFITGALIVVSLGGCALKHPTANLVTGKQLFATNCGACHTLSHADTTGDVGPNLDDAFRQDRADGVKSTSIEGLVDYWIQYPNTQGRMPAMLLKGQDAQDVAAYVAAVAAEPGQDTGALATAIQAKVAPTAAVGKTIFTGVGGCGSCHTLAAAGTTGTVGPNLDQRLKSDCATPQSQKIRGATLDKCIYTAITDPYAYIPSGYSAGIMPDTFEKTLSPSQIQALVAFLSTSVK
ncbi:MAG TPA: c-type cytochrome [Solirubrobacteraceae bacterium]|nr:c-type cytochrome [Solirubrobacteraceae bacterium]